ncbi:hypothetical protein EB796_007032 [Bugula neritina]|uniref:Uncharacterized protein n=1 Tax=Bugula neritina TaxID=10212 RepID=A0A7J7KAL4_BUGNE|nr:hypothetical protein EB796_007032 [Bugula neritina]
MRIAREIYQLMTTGITPREPVPIFTIILSVCPTLNADKIIMHTKIKIYIKNNQTHHNLFFYSIITRAQ